MAAIGWNSDFAMNASLQSQARQYNVNQLIKLLLLNGDRSKDLCDQLDDVFYFQSDIRYAQPESQVTDFKQGYSRKADSKPRLVSSHFGIASYNGPLPDPFLDWIFRELNDGYRTQEQTALLDFIDIFNHRFLAIQHQNRAEQRVSLQSGQPNESTVAKCVESLAGFHDDRSYQQVAFEQAFAGDGPTTEKDTLTEKRLIQSFAGLLYNPRKSSGFIHSLLAAVFACPVAIDQFSGQWLNLDSQDTSKLSNKNSQLGTNTILGSKVWDQQSQIKVNLGPLKYDQLCHLLAGGSQHDALISVLRFASDGNWDALVVLSVELDDVPLSKLTKKSEQYHELGLRLGRNSWIKSQPQRASLYKVSKQTSDSTLGVAQSESLNKDDEEQYVQRLGQTSLLRYPEARKLSTQFRVVL